MPPTAIIRSERVTLESTGKPKDIRKEIVLLTMLGKKRLKEKHSSLKSHDLFLSYLTKKKPPESAPSFTWVSVSGGQKSQCYCSGKVNYEDINAEPSEKLPPELKKRAAA